MLYDREYLDKTKLRRDFTAILVEDLKGQGRSSEPHRAGSADLSDKQEVKLSVSWIKCGGRRASRSVLLNPFNFSPPIEYLTPTNPQHQ